MTHRGWLTTDVKGNLIQHNLVHFTKKEIIYECSHIECLNLAFIFNFELVQPDGSTQVVEQFNIIVSIT